jgi:hypothetical protein
LGKQEIVRKKLVRRFRVDIELYINTALQGWKKYQTTGPLVPENFLSSQEIFPQERKKKDNCKNLIDKRRNSEEKF